VKEQQIQILERVLRPIAYDLNVMLRIPVVPYANGNCAAPLALYSVTAITFLGYLVAPEEIGEDEPIKRFLAFSESYCAGNMRETAGTIYNGLVYDLIPGGMGLGRYGAYVALFDYGQHLVLNADKLALIVLNGIKCLEADLIEDDELANRIWGRVVALSDEGEGNE